MRIRIVHANSYVNVVYEFACHIRIHSHNANSHANAVYEFACCTWIRCIFYFVTCLNNEPVGVLSWCLCEGEMHWFRSICMNSHTVSEFAYSIPIRMFYANSHLLYEFTYWMRIRIALRFLYHVKLHAVYEIAYTIRLRIRHANSHSNSFFIPIWIRIMCVNSYHVCVRIRLMFSNFTSLFWSPI